VNVGDITVDAKDKYA
jgi:hypothetical protein